MQHSTIVLILISLLISVLIASIMEVKGEVIYEDQFTWREHDITLIIVTDPRDTPCLDAAGCAVYGMIDGEQVNLIYLWDKYIPYKDMWGYTTLYHEIKHIECQCNWHEGLSWV